MNIEKMKEIENLGEIKKYLSNEYLILLKNHYSNQVIEVCKSFENFANFKGLELKRINQNDKILLTIQYKNKRIIELQIENNYSPLNDWLLTDCQKFIFTKVKAVLKFVDGSPLEKESVAEDSLIRVKEQIEYIQKTINGFKNNGIITTYVSERSEIIVWDNYLKSLMD